MVDSNPHNMDGPGELSDTDRLLSVLTDGEAAVEERVAFEQRAGGDPELWRQLSDAQQAAAMLERAVEDELGAALNVELPADPARAQSPGRWRIGPWSAAAIGWAAVLVLAALWMFNPGSAPTTDGVNPVDLPTHDPLIGYDQAYNLYLDAPWVIGQMQPHLVHTEELADGTTRYRILRRIEEFVVLPADQEIAVDANGNLTVDPASLRDHFGTSTDK